MASEKGVKILSWGTDPVGKAIQLVRDFVSDVCSRFPVNKQPVFLWCDFSNDDELYASAKKHILLECHLVYRCISA